MSKALLFVLATLALLATTSCQKQTEHTAKAILDRDSASLMTSYGVSTLISDSGVIKYRIVAERWEVNQIKKPSRWTFDKGLFLEQFDEKFHVQAYIQCDTAYYFDQQRLWELRSRVSVLTKDGLRFTSDRLFWDELRHELYSDVFSRLVTPERTLQGTHFRSDEHMTHYTVTNSRGSFASSDFDDSNTNETDSARMAQDSILKNQRKKALPERASGGNSFH